MNSGFYPKVMNPKMSNNIPQMKSLGFQKPFFFGGSQIPSALGLTNTNLDTQPKMRKNKGGLERKK
jgi:hypothetical protein